MVIVGTYTNTALIHAQTKENKKKTHTNKRGRKTCCCKLTIDVMSLYDFNDNESRKSVDDGDVNAFALVLTALLLYTSHFHIHQI